MDISYSIEHTDFIFRCIKLQMHEISLILQLFSEVLFTNNVLASLYKTLGLIWKYLYDSSQRQQCGGYMQGWI